MTAPALSPLFDLALEELLDGDVTCRADDHVAVARIAHTGKCVGPPSFACAEHVAMIANTMAANARARRDPICVDCARPVPVRDWTITPL